MPVSDHYKNEHLHKAAAYLARTPELQTATEEYRTVTDRVNDLQRLWWVAFMDTRVIYRRAYQFLERQQISGDQALTVIRSSLPMAHHYASVKAEHARDIALAARAPDTFRGLHGSDGNLISLTSHQNSSGDKIHPLRAKGFGCSLLGVVVVSPHDGKRYNAFDFYWDAMVMQAHNAYLASPSYQNR